MRNRPAVNRYAKIIEHLFLSHYNKGDTEVPFCREEIEDAARALRVVLPKNLGDLIYSFRYRAGLPASVQALAPAGKTWGIRPAGRSRYCFVAVGQAVIRPALMLAETKIPNATPGIIDKYALTDEQALLAKLRYNRLVDTFAGVTCYSLQSHLRTQVRELGQVETDEIYVGVDRRGAHYVLPVQAKGGRDNLNTVQIEQDILLCRAKFPDLICRPIAAQFMSDDLIAMFEFTPSVSDLSIAAEKHYRLVAPDKISAEDVHRYAASPGDPRTAR